MNISLKVASVCECSIRWFDSLMIPVVCIADVDRHCSYDLRLVKNCGEAYRAD